MISKNELPISQSGSYEMNNHTGDKIKKVERKKVIVYPISWIFVDDNSETLGELVLEYRISKEHGIKRLELQNSK